MISLNGTTIRDPNEYTPVKSRVRGKHLILGGGYQAYSKNSKISIAMTFRNIDSADYTVINNIYENQFVDFDTINFVMQTGYPEEDLNIEGFLRVENLEYNVNGKYNLDVTFDER